MVQWSRARKRNERQGILAESEAIERAMAESEADSDERANQREREAARRESLDRNMWKHSLEPFANSFLTLQPARISNCRARLFEVQRARRSICRR